MVANSFMMLSAIIIIIALFGTEIILTHAFTYSTTFQLQQHQLQGAYNELPSHTKLAMQHDDPLIQQSPVDVQESSRVLCHPSSSSSRRHFLSKAVWGSVASFAAVATLSTSNAEASVSFETDRYGDKELKIATVKKLKQTLRNEMVADPRLVPLLFKLAVNDAMGFRVVSEAGGLDGSVVYEMEAEQNVGLKPALDAILRVKKSLQRTNELSLADVIAFGGGCAVEVAGGPRMTIQIGRYDAKDKNGKVEPVSFNYNNSGSLLAAFKKAGLSAREMTLMACTIGQLEQIVEDKLANAGDEEEDDLVDNSWQNSVGKSFGAPTEIFGAGIGGPEDFDTSYIQTLLQAANKKGSKAAALSLLDQMLLEEPTARPFLQKYGGNKKAFELDLVDAYLKMTSLGELYETRLMSA